MIVLRGADERGHADHGWLDSYHTFSFADYHDPEHMGFRALRVINEDRVRGGQGFGTHPHRDFEIMTYIVSGALRHQDTMGHQAVMRAGGVQRISAGTGIAHSEFNDSPTDSVHFLQIWLSPSRKGVTPNYTQQSFSQSQVTGLTLACSGDGRQGSIPMNQDADVFIGSIQQSGNLNHALRHGYGWVQLIEGIADLNGLKLSPGDGAALDDEKDVRLATESRAHFLLFDLS